MTVLDSALRKGVVVAGKEIFYKVMHNDNGIYKPALTRTHRDWDLSEIIMDTVYQIGREYSSNDFKYPPMAFKTAGRAVDWANQGTSWKKDFIPELCIAECVAYIWCDIYFYAGISLLSYVGEINRFWNSAAVFNEGYGNGPHDSVPHETTVAALFNFYLRQPIPAKQFAKCY